MEENDEIFEKHILRYFHSDYLMETPQKCSEGGAYLGVKTTNWFFNFKNLPRAYSEEYGITT